MPPDDFAAILRPALTATLPGPSFGGHMKACFFDLDGTLLDTLADIGGACNAVLAAHGYPVHPVSAYRQMVGNGFPILMRRALPESVVAQGPQERLDALTEEGRRYYAAHLSIRTTPYPGLVAARQVGGGPPFAVAEGIPVGLADGRHELVYYVVRVDGHLLPAKVLHLHALRLGQIRKVDSHLISPHPVRSPSRGRSPGTCRPV